MAPTLWIAGFVAAGVLSELIVPFLTQRFGARFPLHLMRGRAGEARSLAFARILLFASLFGAIVGLIGGVALAVKLLATLL